MAGAGWALELGAVAGAAIAGAAGLDGAAGTGVEVTGVLGATVVVGAEAAAGADEAELGAVAVDAEAPVTPVIARPARAIPPTEARAAARRTPLNQVRPAIKLPPAHASRWRCHLA